MQAIASELDSRLHTLLSPGRTRVENTATWTQIQSFHFFFLSFFFFSLQDVVQLISVGTLVCALCVLRAMFKSLSTAYIQVSGLLPHAS